MSAATVHPLAGALAGAGVLGAGSALEGWYTAELGVADPSLASLAADRDALLDAIDREASWYGTDARDVGASFLLGHLAWRVVAPLAATYLANGQVPIVDAATVAVRPLPGIDGAGRVTFETARFHVLADAPEAEHPDADPVADVDTLRQAFRDTVVATIGVLAPALRPWARRSVRTQWGELSDVVASTFQAVGEVLGEPARARTEAERVLDGADPLWGGANWVSVEACGARGTHRVRNTCCLAYKLGAGTYCDGCPLVDAATRLAGWLDQLTR